MIRKQFYVRERQDRALKRRARDLGISEAELVRQSLDEVLRDGRAFVPRSGQRLALRGLLDNARELSRHHRVPDGYRFDRDALYEERAEGRPRRS